MNKNKLIVGVGDVSAEINGSQNFTEHSVVFDEISNHGYISVIFDGQSRVLRVGYTKETVVYWRTIEGLSMYCNYRLIVSIQGTDNQITLLPSGFTLCTVQDAKLKGND